MFADTKDDMYTKDVLLVLGLGIMLLTMAGCAHQSLEGSLPDADGPFLFASNAMPVSGVALAARMEHAAYILVGEGHTNACDHRAEARILSALAGSGSKPVIGLEMVSSDMQPILDAWNAGEIAPDQIADALHWKDRWGYPFTQYAPLFDLSRKYGLAMAALNVPRRVVDKVRTTGLKSVPPQDRQYIPDPIIPASDAQTRALEKTFAMHAQMTGAPGHMMESFFLIQSLWDTGMAVQAEKWRQKTGQPVFIVAGAGHVENRWGIAYRLAVLDPQATTISILPARDKADITPEGAEYYFVCPSRHRQRIGLVLEKGARGLKIKAVEPDSRASRAGLRAGDVLLQGNGTLLKTPMDIHSAAAPAARQGKDLVLKVLRDGREMKVVIKLTRVQ